MKKFMPAAVVALLAGFQPEACAQSCLPGGITFDKQAQIDSFAINYPGCVSIIAQMLVFPATPGAITNLSGLSQLVSVGGDVWINDNVSLTSFQGLNNLTTIGNNLRIRYNTNVLDLSGLGNITTVGGELDISNNPMLISTGGLNSLSSVGSNCIISNNGHLTDMSSLMSLKSIGGYLAVTVDTSLTTLVGLDSIDHTTITNMQIVNSKRLVKCNVKSICDYLAIPGNPATIGGNKFGCASRPQVENNCAAMTGIDDNDLADVRLLPNPAAGFVVVTGDRLARAGYAIRDVRGRLLKEGTVGNGYIDLLDLDEGVYLLALQTANSNAVWRIVVAR